MSDATRWAVLGGAALGCLLLLWRTGREVAETRRELLEALKGLDDRAERIGWRLKAIHANTKKLAGGED